LTGESEKVVLDLRKRFPDNAQVALKTAAHYLPNKPELARTAIDDVLKKDPKDPQALALLGELQYIAGQDTEAQATLSSPDLIQSPLAKPHFLLGSIAARRGQLDVAQGEYRKALTKDPRYLAASLALADLLLIRNNTLAARAEIVKALATQPDNPEARLIKATIDRIDKQYPEAERELLRLVKEQPDNPLVYRQLGLYFEARGKTSEAEKSFARALELQPDSPGMLQEAAFFHVRARQSDRAIQLIDRVSAGKTQAFQDELAGIIYAQAGKTREADAAFRKAVEKEPGRLSAMNFLAGLHFEAGRHDEALEWLNESLRKNPSQPKTLAIRGAILQSKGNLEGAKKDYALALEGDPKLGATANNLAYLLAEEGRDLPTALKWSQVAQSNQPDNPSAADTLGWIHYKLGNYDLAREQLQIAVARQPANGVYQYHLGMALKAAQRNAEAQAALTKAATSASDSRERTLAQAELKQWGAKP
jgi:tetratricopeptide (TPR) repeat protein